MKQTKTETGRNKPRVLLVDDERIIRDIISRVLEKEGYEVNTAASLMQALETASQKTFDLLITDIYLGQGTGTDVIRQLRNRICHSADN